MTNDIIQENRGIKVTVRKLTSLVWGVQKNFLEEARVVRETHGERDCRASPGGLR